MAISYCCVSSGVCSRNGDDDARCCGIRHGGMAMMLCLRSRWEGYSLFAKHAGTEREIGRFF